MTTDSRLPKAGFVYFAIAVLALAPFYDSRVLADDLADNFTIEYVVENNLISAGVARYRLNKLLTSGYEVSFETEPSGLFRLTRKGRILETSKILVDEEQLQSLVYTHNNYSEPERSFSIEFEQISKQATITSADATNTIEYPAQTLDRLSMILSLMSKIPNEPDLTNFSIPLFEKSGVRTVSFQVQEPEILETPVGTFQTTVLKKSRRDSSKHEIIWFAKLTDDALVYPIQFEQYKRNSLVVRLKIIKFLIPDISN